MKKKRVRLVVLDPERGKVAFVFPENLFCSGNCLALGELLGSSVSLSSSAVKHDWEKMTESVQNHIGSLNWGYRVALREKKVVYENAYGKFIGPHRIKVIVKLHSVFFPGSFKTVFIGVSRKKKSLPICFLNKSK